MSRTRRRAVALATVALIAGASFFGAAGAADAKPDPGQQDHIWYCIDGGFFPYTWYDDGPITDLLHHAVEYPLGPNVGGAIHHLVGCELSHPNKSLRL